MNLRTKMSQRLNWNIFLAVALVAGILLRVTFVDDMEYKEDEEYNFIQSQRIGTSDPWPWYGIPSGVYLVNPGMSIWVFAILAKLFGIHSPTSLANALQLFAVAGIALILPFAFRWIEKEDRDTWFWAYALAMVNPFLVLYQRKLWPEPFLPFFTMLTLMGWWRRETVWGAFFWGLIGAWLGQIHMSGFFFAASLFLWTAFFKIGSKPTHWRAWLSGSILGALPLIPWFIYLIQNPTHQSVSAGWSEIIQLKYWVFWLTDPTGLHLGNPLGLLRGPTLWNQISDFARYPIIANHATYGVGIAHGVSLIAVVVIFSRGLNSLWMRKQEGLSLWTGRSSSTAFVQNSALWGCGILMTVTGVVIRRYYMAVTFPLEFICLIRMARPNEKIGRYALIALWIAECFISIHFVGYIHVNQGSTQGDYGIAYHLVHPQKEP